jgi:type I restriction enzyme S subunit
MVLKRGYKQTELGKIPENWDTCTLGDAVVFLDGRRRPVKESDRAKVRGIYPYYGASGIVDYVNDYLFDEDLILLGEDGENILSRNTRLAFKVSGKIWVNNHAHVLRPKNNFDISFLADYLESIDYTLYNTGTAQPKLNQYVCTRIPIAVPPLPEQRAIAAASSDVDALLASLDALIAKKRLIQQGTMQELLTGKRRLPGFGQGAGYRKTEAGIFPDDWELIPLRLVSSMNGRIGWQGLTQAEFTSKDNDPFLITGMNFKDGKIRWDEVYHVADARYEMAKQIQLRSGDVLMTKDGTIGKMLYVDQIPYPGKSSLNSHLLVFRPLQNKYHPKFMFYQLSSEVFHKHIELEKSGSTFFGITQEAVGKYVAFLPPIKEQEAIAEVLTDMEADIYALEQQREKTYLIKQGMMQELLTGRTRLV